ncbi:hypothetical protein DEJ50_09875 [Streptomyces venezuelae]|uniref:Uncharacterized protein n=1 Tax=Streptomyces venezuelae TaxID=54571 RepID=A0A5P2CYU9_STRVZ|nr:hypothetical protein DEJ50_09875 [Streptomyces venezuelae]
MTALAGLHFLVAVILYRSFDDLAREGFWDAATGNAQRESELWFFLAGFGLLALGTLSARIVRDTGRLPGELGWYLLAIGVPLMVLNPASGAPGLIVLGVYALVTTARQRSDAARRSDATQRTDSDRRPGSARQPGGLQGHVQQ